MLTAHSVAPADGGKVQAWSWHTFENCQSINAHQEAVTSVQVGGSLTYRPRMLKLFFMFSLFLTQTHSFRRSYLKYFQKS